MVRLSLLVLCAVVCMASARPEETQRLLGFVTDRLPTERELLQNKNARYEFSSNINDKISDLSNTRSEVREGLKVTGMYSYSDGYYQRTVHYVADDKGYRITGEEMVKLKDEGPKIDLSGIASVDAAAHGARTQYAVKSVAVEDKTYEEVNKQK